MSFETYRSAASLAIEEEYFARIQEDRDAEASELRLSVIEYLDRQHAVVTEQLNAKPTSSMARREHALWCALELVRGIERKIGYDC